MPYILRDADNKVVGIAQSDQQGWPGEWLPDDHPDVVAYNTPKLSKLDALVEAYRTLPVDKRVKYAGIMAPARNFVEKGDTEAAALLLSKLSVSEDEQPLKQAFIEIVTGG